MPDQEIINLYESYCEQLSKRYASKFLLLLKQNQSYYAYATDKTKEHIENVSYVLGMKIKDHSAGLFSICIPFDLSKKSFNMLVSNGFIIGIMELFPNVYYANNYYTKAYILKPKKFLLSGTSILDKLKNFFLRMLFSDMFLSLCFVNKYWVEEATHIFNSLTLSTKTDRVAQSIDFDMKTTINSIVKDILDQTIKEINAKPPTEKMYESILEKISNSHTNDQLPAQTDNTVKQTDSIAEQNTTITDSIFMTKSEKMALYTFNSPELISVSKADDSYTSEDSTDVSNNDSNNDTNNAPIVANTDSQKDILEESIVGDPYIVFKLPNKENMYSYDNDYMIIDN